MQEVPDAPRPRSSNAFVRLLDICALDVRYAFRSFRKSPAFTAVAVATLTLAIGANTALFSAVYGLLLRPLPYRDASRLVLIEGEYNRADRPVAGSFSIDELDDLRDQLRTVESFAFYANGVFAVSNGIGSEVTDAAIVSDRFFSTLDGSFAAGRPLGRADDRTPSVVISERFARRFFNTPAQAVGAALVLNLNSYTVIGVAREAFRFPEPTVDIWAPAGYARQMNTRCCSFFPVARLRSGATVSLARTDLADAVQVIRATKADSFEDLRMSVIGLRDRMVSRIRPALMMLWAAVGLVLLGACANVVNLLLARNGARSREIAVRFALGATRGRVLLDALIESAVLAAAGTIAGVAFAAIVTTAIARLNPSGLSRLEGLDVDAPVLLFAAALGLITTVAIGLLPAFQSARETASLKSSSGVTTVTGRRLRALLSVMQLAVAMVLLVGATLLGQSFVRLLHTDLGVDNRHVTAATINLPRGRKHPDTEIIAMMDRVIARVRTLPEVRAAGVGTGLPPNASRIGLLLKRAGDKVNYIATAVPATPGYFQAMGLRLLKGRHFTDDDRAGRPAVMMMGAATARRFLGEGDPIGRTMKLPVILSGATTSEEMTLVGVLGDVKYSGLDVPPDDQVYRPFGQQPWPAVFLTVRTDRDPPGFAATLRRAIWSVDPTISIESVRTLDAAVAEAAAPSQYRTLLLGWLAALGLAIAALGLYGVIAYSVTQRTREIGVRMALGASAADVMRLVLTEGAWLAAAGVTIGLAAAYATTRVLAALLFGVTPTDPLSFAAATAALLTFALVASYVPARRAGRVDPVDALRAE